MVEGAGDAIPIISDEALRRLVDDPWFQPLSDADRLALRVELQEAVIMMRAFAGWQSPARVRKQFDALRDAAAQFLTKIQSFSEADEPGWTLLRSASERHLAQIAAQLDEIEVQVRAAHGHLRELQSEVRDNDKLDADQHLEQAEAKLAAIKKRKRQVEATYASYQPELPPEVIFGQMRDGAVLLREWLSLVSLAEWEEDGKLLGPETSFVVKVIPRLLRNHLGRKPGVSREEGGGPGGPSIRFAVALLAELGLNSPKTKKPFTATAVENLWERYGVVGSNGA